VFINLCLGTLRESMVDEDRACDQHVGDNFILESDRLPGSGNDHQKIAAPARFHLGIFRRFSSLLFAFAVVAVLWKECPSMLHWVGSLMGRHSELSGFIEQPLLCCGPQNCLIGAPDAVCGPTRSPVLCAAGNIAAENSNGFGYCCDGKITFPCQEVCLDTMTRQLHLNRGGTCNGVAPQGFRASNTIMPVNLPWGSSLQAYQLDGMSQASLPSGFFQYGEGDFSLVATLSQTAARRFGQNGLDNFTIYSKFDEQFRTGFKVRIIYMNSLQPSADFLIQQGTDREERVISSPVPIRDGARFPREYRFIRRGMTLHIFRDGEQVGNTTFNRRINVNTMVPFSIGAQGNPPNISQAILGLFANMRSESFADFP